MKLDSIRKTSIFSNATTLGADAHERMSDLELLSGVQARSRRALEILYDRHASRALGLASKILRDRDLAEDVVVESFWRVWQRAAQFEIGRGTFTSWYFGIVRNLAIDQLRRRRRQPEPSDADALEYALHLRSPREQDIGALVMQRLDTHAVRDAVDALPPAQREVIRLAYMEGLTRQEIALKLGQPLGTVHTRARLGLGKLREIMRAAA
jgi:RNA polymerase sigma-70 factor (ECF subfamily)